MRFVALVLCAVLASAGPASGWGFEAHKLIADEAVRRLPRELQPLFGPRRAFIVEHSIDPDLWRTAGFAEEAPHHFLDLDYREYGKDPFDALPRDYDRAVEKFGRDVVNEQGTLPWRVQEFYGKLRREFEALARPSPPRYAADNIAFYTAVLAHYVSDGHVPLHAVVNYDGQLTGQRGLHGRWETELFERSRARLRIDPPAAKPITNPRDAVFTILLASNRLVPSVLEADKAAAAGRTNYDDEYFAAFAERQLPTLERRLNESIAAVVSIVVGAWEAAGKPPVTPRSAPSPRKVPRR